MERSLPLLQDIGVAFINQTGCVSCHHNSVVSMAVAAARAHGYSVNEATATKQASTIGTYLESWRERTVQNVPIAGGADTISYLLLGLAADGYAPDAATDAQARWLKRRQAGDGRWPLATLRPPIESNDIQVTAVSMRALQIFAPPAQRGEYARSVDRARAWLTTAAATAAEERAFRLMGLRWAGASTDVLSVAARDLLAIQHDDGGWAQLESMASDAYATGEALVALRESGVVAVGDRAYRKGLEYLLRTQIEDGSWIVETRSVPIQAYFESGFPYGVNQWVSAAATGWATTALALASETPQAPGAIPRPPAPPPGPARPEDGSAAPDGYAPIPQWLGQTRAPHPSTVVPFDVETAAEGLSGAFCFHFLPDGRMIVGERPGRIRIVAANGTVSEPLGGMPADLWAKGQGLFEVLPDRAFASNRRIFLTYTVLPEGSNQAALPRNPGVLMVASATLSADDRTLEHLKVLLNAEGTGGRLIQAPDGTLLITSTVPGGVGIDVSGLAATAAADQRHGQNPEDQCRWIDPEGQPLRRPHRRASRDLCARHSGLAGRGDASPHRSTLAERSRTARRRRDQRGGEGQELRLPDHRLRPRLQRQADQRRQDRAARAWSSRSISGRPTSPRPGLPSTPARAFRRGRVICSCPRSPANRWCASS